MEKVRLGSQIKQIRGVSYKPTDLHNDLNDSSVILLRANNISDGKLNFDDVVYVDKSKVKEEQYLKKGDILVCASSGSKELVGKAAFVKKDFTATFGAFCKLIRPMGCIAEYLGHYFNSPTYREKISALALGANINNIRNEHIDELFVCFPNELEQKSIASLLDKVTNLIDKRKEQLSKLDELAKARFVELFGNGHDGKTTVKMLGSICKFQQGTQIPVEEQFEEQNAGYKRFLRIIDYTQAPQPPRYVNVNGKEVDEKSVVIVRYGATAGFVGRGYQGILANNLFEIMPDETILSKEFLFLALKYGTFEKEVHDKAFGAAMPALSFSMMNDIPVVVPMPEQQSKFVCFVEQTDKSKLEVQKSLEKLELLKKALMQKYFG